MPNQISPFAKSAVSKPTNKQRSSASKAAAFGFAALLASISFASSASAAVGDVSTIAGSTIGFADGPGATAQFANPYGVVSDGEGNLYIADTDNNRIRKMNTATGQVTTIAGSTTIGYLDGPGATAQFHFPTGLALLNATTLVVADSYNNRIRSVDLGTGAVSTIAGGAQGRADGVGNAAMFYTPYDVAVSNGTIYVADSGNNQIRAITASTGNVKTIAGDGVPGAADGLAVISEFNLPYGLTVDGNSIFVADTMNHKLRRIDLTSSTVSSLGGNGSPGSTNGPILTATFNYPYRVVSDGAGRLYVSDDGAPTTAEGSRLRVVDLNMGSVANLAGTGAGGFADGTATTAILRAPVGLALDKTGNLYFADANNHRIRQVSLAGAPAAVVATVATSVPASVASSVATTMATTPATSVSAVPTVAAPTVTAPAVSSSIGLPPAPLNGVPSSLPLGPQPTAPLLLAAPQASAATVSVTAEPVTAAPIAAAPAAGVAGNDVAAPLAVTGSASGAYGAASLVLVGLGGLFATSRRRRRV